MSTPAMPDRVDPGPLAGRRVLVARAAHQQNGLSNRLRSLGAEPVEVPLLAIDPPADDGAALRAAVDDLASGRLGVVGITSPNGASALVAIADQVKGAREALAAAWIGCVGPGTARRFAEVAGRQPDLVAPVHTTAGLGAAFPRPGDLGRGARVLLARADIASPELPAALAADGWAVDDIHAYRTRLVTDLPDDVLDRLASGDIDAVAAGSPSTVDALVAVLDGRDLRALLVSIGPVTSARAREHDLSVAAEADPHDLDGLLVAVTAALEAPTT